jgi:hypothetical protein
MIASMEQFQLITTFNEWGEGSAVESAQEWSSASGYGSYLDALHNNGVPIGTPTPMPTVTVTDTATPTDTTTPTPTASATDTPTDTSTTTPTVTVTDTSTPTDTPTPIPTTPTPTQTDTPSPTPSPTTPTPTSTAPNSFTFTPVADSYVNASSTSTNYGISTTLRVDGSPFVNSYLRFNLSGLSGTVTKATLRIYANSASTSGIQAQGVSDISWGEKTITYANAPAMSGVVNKSTAVKANSWVEIDVTSLVSANGLLSLAASTSGGTAISLASRESGANAPQLVVITQ